MATLRLAGKLRRSLGARVNVAAEIRRILRPNPSISNLAVHARLSTMRLRTHDAAINAERNKLTDPEGTVWGRTAAALRAEATYYGENVADYWETLRGLTATDMRLA